MKLFKIFRENFEKSGKFLDKPLDNIEDYKKNLGKNVKIASRKLCAEIRLY